MDLVIKTENLTKQYGSKLVVNAVNMNVERGDIYGFIGKNGAGKTTTMKLLLGTSYPTSGKIELFGSEDLNHAREKIGSLVETPSIYKNCTAYENMKRFSILFGGTDEDIKEILEFVGLGNTNKKKAGKFSLGMRQRLGIAIAMLGKPELLILDEPVNGLDPTGIKEIRDLLLKLNHEKGVTILISSHLLDELSKIATKYGIINDGVLIEEITQQELNERCSENLKIVTNNNDEAFEFLKLKLPEANLEIKENAIFIYSKADSKEINKMLVNADFEVSEMNYTKGGFEEYFIGRINK